MPDRRHCGGQRLELWKNYSKLIIVKYVGLTQISKGLNPINWLSTVKNQ